MSHHKLGSPAAAVTRSVRTWGRAVGGILLLLFVLGCDQAMRNQGKVRPLASSTFFADGQSARPRVSGTIARGEFHQDEALYTGRQGNSLSETFPFPITRAVMERGQERYQIFCTPCHDQTGSGRGTVVERGFRPPPSYHIDRLRLAPPGHFFDVMTRGFGAMPEVAPLVPPDDRWAIAAYIRALQLSQHGSRDDVPTDVLRELEARAK